MTEHTAPVPFPHSAPLYSILSTPGCFRAAAIRAADTFFDTNPDHEWVKVGVSEERGPQHAYYYFRQGPNGRAELLRDVIEETPAAQADADADVIARMNKHVEEHVMLSASGVRYWSLSRYTTPYLYEQFTDAALRTLDAQAERIAALEAEVAGLRSAMDGIGGN